MTVRRIHASSCGLETWKERLASPDRQWQRGKSAFELAVAWELAEKSDQERGLPREIKSIIDQVPDLKGAKLIFGAVEHKVPLPHGSKPSQSDLWAVLQLPSQGLVSATIEGKAKEPFDETIARWLADASPNSGKPARLEYLRNELGLRNRDIDNVRYQLLHRTAAAVIEARRIQASIAAMIVHSFCPNDRSFADARRFADLLDADLIRGSLVPARPIGEIALYLGWAQVDPASNDDILSLV